MTSDQIEYFMSCASCLNFSLAAKYHYVSVSTLSRNISALEEELGVKLFKRGYHGHTLTPEGLNFFDFAENTSRELADFWLSIGKEPEGELLRIACYPFDNTFGAIVDCFSQLPPEYLGKKYKVHFVSPGTMMETVEKGRAHMGVISAADMAGHEGEFASIPFFYSEYDLYPKKGSRLDKSSGVSMEELAEMELVYGDFLPGDLLDGELAEKRVESAEDISAIGMLTMKRLPELAWRRRVEMEDRHFLLPRVMELPPLKRRSIPVTGTRAHMEFLLFWKENFGGATVAKLRELTEYLSRNIKTY